MAKIKQLFLLLCLLVSVFSYSQIIVGAERTNSYIQLIQEKKIGGVITFGGSIHGTYHNIQHYQSISEIPLLVAADYERGTGQWMKGGTLFPSNMAVVATNNTDLAYMQGSITAKEAKAIGVNITFSPVMDINNNKDNPIINFRS